MNLNLKLDDEILDDYLNKFYEVSRPQIVNIDLAQLFVFVLLIMKNQSHLFRKLYNGDKEGDIKLD